MIRVHLPLHGPELHRDYDANAAQVNPSGGLSLYLDDVEMRRDPNNPGAGAQPVVVRRRWVETLAHGEWTRAVNLDAQPAREGQ